MCVCVSLSLSLSLRMCTYVYVYIYIHLQMSYSLNSWKGLYRGLHRERLKDLLRGKLRVQTIAHICVKHSSCMLSIYRAI